MTTAQSHSHAVYRGLTLDTDQDSIRLLTILPGAADSALHCRLNVVLLTADIHYEAISYTWGSDEEVHEIDINEDSDKFCVRPNLLDLLVSIRNEKVPRVVWIDAICIDQENLAERNRQVSMMREIYSMAKQVVVWLGGPVHAKLLPAIHYINSSSAEVEDSTLPEFVRESLLEISRNAYWTRVWILQEVISARQITVLVGGRAGFAWWRLEWAINSAFNTQQNTQNADLTPDETYHLRRLIRHRRQFLKHGTISLEEALYRYEDCKSTNFRDRIFGLLGIVQGRGFTIDYTVSREELFIQTLNFCQSSNPIRLGATLRRAFQLKVGHLQHERKEECLPQKISPSMPQHMMSAYLSFYGVLAECLDSSHDNHQTVPTLWLCDPDKPIKRGYRGTLVHDMAVGLWALRHFDDEYWLRKSTQDFEVNTIMTRCYPAAVRRHNPFLRIGGRRFRRVAHSSELVGSIRLQYDG
ncbi:uncharacterized protein Z520_04627 [Fonsecaea multimorphosa CBS 102226]|uniref:Heterokaryon incompatibility domain-containing protein n=1 Tax=Fonsecaea multimorphosa CBS 102226 TaxID=1442371 RepID=A0A0D2KA22_9EURO|nr:uncharacterized protein Z520_04627 [Fonsecaea multimorphosa CBS 102226]KIX99989.1 hypothetical protein Z520_04627 [Fonsecaea multimorphosa CBS 102226]